MNKSPDKDRTIALALGRIFRIASRPYQDGDAEDYERCRRIIMELADPEPCGYAPNYARDYGKGAASQW